jgi:hypothetical protein
MISDAAAPISRRVFILATAAVTAGCLHSQPRGQIRLAAGEAGGLYLAFAKILANRITARYPGIGVSVIATEGSVENLSRLRSSDVDLGLAQADVAERDRTAGPVGTAPQAVARLYEDYLQVVVRNSAAVQQLSDLQGSRVSIVARRIRSGANQRGDVRGGWRFARRRRSPTLSLRLTTATPQHFTVVSRPVAEADPGVPNPKAVGTHRSRPISTRFEPIHA